MKRRWLRTGDPSARFEGLETRQLLSTNIATQSVGMSPVALAADPVRDILYMYDGRNEQVQSIDPTTGRTLHYASAGLNEAGYVWANMVVSPEGDRLYVMDGFDGLATFALPSLERLSKCQIADSDAVEGQLVAMPSGRLYLSTTTYDSGFNIEYPKVIEVDPLTGQDLRTVLDRGDVGSSMPLVGDPEHDAIYALNPEGAVTKIDLADPGHPVLTDVADGYTYNESYYGPPHMTIDAARGLLFIGGKGFLDILDLNHNGSFINRLFLQADSGVVVDDTAGLLYAAGRGADNVYGDETVRAINLSDFSVAATYTIPNDSVRFDPEIFAVSRSGVVMTAMGDTGFFNGPTDNIAVLIGGPTTLELDYGDFTVNGFVYVDANGNGQLDLGEASGNNYVGFGFDANRDGVLDQGYTNEYTTINPDGSFTIHVFPSGTQHVLINPPGIFGDTAKLTVPSDIAYQATAGGSATLNIGIQYVQNPEYVVIWDRDGDGIRGYDADDWPISTGRMYYDMNDDGVREKNEPSTSFGPSGGGPFASFIDVKPGQYHLRYDGPLPLQVDGGELLIDVLGDASDSGSATVYLVAPPRSVSGGVYDDSSGDGFYDWYDAVPGQRVYVDRNRNERFNKGEAYAFTDSQGLFVIPDAPSGGRYVRLDTSHGAVPLSPVEQHVKISDSNRPIVEFAILPPFQPATISGTLFGDRNQDEKQNSDEFGYSGWTLFLDDNDNGRRDSNEGQAVTDRLGNFSFTGLRPGDHRLRVKTVGGYEVVGKRAVWITLSGGESASRNFGVAPIT